LVTAFRIYAQDFIVIHTAQLSNVLPATAVMYSRMGSHAIIICDGLCLKKNRGLFISTTERLPRETEKKP
jgi:hypothetical protein